MRSVYFDELISFLSPIGGISRYFQNLASENASPISNSFFIRPHTSLVNVFCSLVRPLLHPRSIYHPTYINPFIFLYRNPVVFTIHDLIFELQRPHLTEVNFFIYHLSVFFRRLCALRADAIIVPSYSTKYDLLKVYPFISPSKIHVIFHGLDHFDYSDPGICPDSSLPHQSFILFVGSRAEYKGFHVLLSAIASLPSHIRPKLVCVGKPFNREELLLLDRTTIDSVSIPASNHQLSWLYKNCGVFVYSSFCEGFGFPPLEAYFHGTNFIVCSRISTSVEFCSDFAHFYDPLNSSELTSLLTALLSKDTSIQYSSQPLPLIPDNFSWSSCSSLHSSLYQSLLQQR